MVGFSLSYSVVMACCKSRNMWLWLNVRCAQLKGEVGKAVPLQAWTGPEGSRKLRFPDHVTMAQNGGKVASLTHRSLLPPGNNPGTYFC